MSNENDDSSKTGEEKASAGSLFLGPQSVRSKSRKQVRFQTET